MQQRRDSKLIYIVLTIFFLFVLAYAYYEAQGALYGPSIEVTAGVTQVQDPFVLVKGQAERIAALSMNGRNIAVTEAGDFAEPYLLAPGYNRIILDATDRYGRTTSKVVEIIYTGPPYMPGDETTVASAPAVAGTSTSQIPTSSRVAPSP